MSYLINNQQNLNEVIFAKRNKSYGAYAIRSAYGNTVFKSLTIMMLGFGTFISLAYYFSNRNNLPEQKNYLPLDADTMVTVFNMPEPDIKKPKENNTSSSSGTSSSEITSTTIDTSAVDTHSTLNTDPTPNVAVNSGTPGIGPETPGTFTGSTTGTSTVNTEPKGLIYVDSPPEYDGGLNALRKFVAERVHYPPVALDEGKGGTIYVKFVVDEKGKVSNLSLLNNLGYGLDQEALRVVGLIPNFIKPAMAGGQPVKVYYQLPIKFTVAK